MSEPDLPEGEKKFSHVRHPGREIVVEPLLMGLALVAFPMAFISQQYIVARITADKTAGLALNISDDDNDGSRGQCGMNKSSPAYIFQQEVQGLAAEFNIYNSITTGIPALFVSMFLGNYSDKKGRRYAIIPPAIGFLFRPVSYILVISLHLPIQCLYVGSFLEGCFGTYETLLMGCISYIADQTAPEKRQFRITIAELIMLLSGILGPVGVGVLIQRVGFLPPLIVVVVGNILSLLYAIFLVPETVIPQENVRFFDTDNIKKTAILFTTDTESKRRWKLCSLFSAFFLVAIVSHSMITQLFQLNYPLCWNSELIGYFGATFIGVAALGGLGTSKIFKMCIPDIVITIIAGVANFLSNIMGGFVYNTAMMFGTIVFAPVSVLFSPTMRTLMSKLVSPTEQGTLFGAYASIEVLCGLIGTSTTNLVYKATLNIYTGFVFFYIALFYFAGTFIVTIVGIISYIDYRRKASSPMQLIIDDQ